MGRIKDFIIDLQNKYGQDLEDLPKGFSMDKYMSEKAKEASAIKKELFCKTVKGKNIEK